MIEIVAGILLGIVGGVVLAACLIADVCYCYQRAKGMDEYHKYVMDSLEKHDE